MSYPMMQTVRTVRLHAPLLLLKYLWLFLALLLLVTAAARSYAAEFVSATGVMEGGEAQFRSIEDYQCVADVQSNLGKATESGTVECLFKQPRMLRLKVIRGTSLLTLDWGSFFLKYRAGRLLPGIGWRVPTPARRMK